MAGYHMNLLLILTNAAWVFLPVKSFLLNASITKTFIWVLSSLKLELKWNLLNKYEGMYVQRLKIFFN